MNDRAISQPPEETAQNQTANWMDTLVGYILLIGVLLSVFFVLAGTIWNWTINNTLNLPSSFVHENYLNFLRISFEQLRMGTIGPALLVNLGIATLLFTPYLRVAASFFYLALADHNVKYSFFTFFVLSVLTYSLFFR
mgnify:CR=1 FL=1